MSFFSVVFAVVVTEKIPIRRKTVTMKTSQVLLSTMMSIITWAVKFSNKIHFNSLILEVKKHFFKLNIPNKQNYKNYCLLRVI